MPCPGQGGRRPGQPGDQRARDKDFIQQIYPHPTTACEHADPIMSPENAGWRGGLTHIGAYEGARCPTRESPQCDRSFEPKPSFRMGIREARSLHG